MAKIETTLPTVQYGNVKVTFTPEELGVDISDAAAIGVATAVYLNLFTQGFKAGSQMDVSAPVSASREAPGTNPKWTPGVAPTDPEVLAKVALNEGLGGVTEVPAGDVVAHEGAPWEQPAVDTPKKPWEISGGSPAAEW